MRIVVTGAAGFIGQMVVRALDARDTITLDGQERRISAILAIDIAAAPLDAMAASGRRIHALPGTVTDPAVLARIVSDAPDLIVHLAAVVSGQAEVDYDIGMAVNLHGTLALIEACRQIPRPPVVVAASSIAVFSATDNGTVTEDTIPAPLTSYGMQKLCSEHLLRDATRKGFLHARCLRYPTISVRPGKPNAAASGFASGIIREPMAGLEAALPVGRDAKMHLASPSKALEFTLHAAALPQSALGLDVGLTLPGISVSVGEMIDTLSHVMGPEVAALIRPAPDALVNRLVMTWPGAVLAPKVEALGFVPNTNFAELVEEHRVRMTTTT